jgi:hypothetical protein
VGEGETMVELGCREAWEKGDDFNLLFLMKKGK